MKDTNDRMSISQGHFNAILVGVMVLIVVASLIIFPEVAAICGKILLLIVNFSWAFLILIAIVFGPGIITWIMRATIDYGDSRIEGYEPVSDWIHVVICIIISLVLAAVWMIWGVRLFVGLPSWIHNLYEHMEWLIRLNEYTPWGWGVISLIFAIWGYIWGNQGNRRSY